MKEGDYTEEKINDIKKGIVLAVVGGRDFDDYDFLEQKLDEIHEKHIITRIVSGGAKGADKMAEYYAQKRGFKITVFKPDWDKYGKSAGIRRNADIVNECDQLIAFWDNVSRGTKNSIERAKRAGKKVDVILYMDD